MKEKVEGDEGQESQEEEVAMPDEEMDLEDEEQSPLTSEEIM